MNPIILYNNILLSNQAAAPTATDTAAGYDVNNVLDYRTFTLWKAASFGTKYLTFQLDPLGLNGISVLALAGHNLNTAAATVSVEASADNVSWSEVSVGPFTPASNKTLIKLANIPLSVYGPYYRLKIVTASMAPQIGCVYIGTYITFEYPADSPFSPRQKSIIAEDADSKNGNYLGATTRYRPLKINPTFSNFTRTWIENTYEVFWNNHASLLKPFFWAEDLVNLPNDMYYVRMDKANIYDTPKSILSYYDKLQLNMIGAVE